MKSLWNELQYAVRLLRKSPVFTIIAVLSLAIGIGANTAIFSVVDAVLLRPLPYSDPSRLVWATEHFGFGPSTVVSADFPAWKDGNHVFEQIGAFGGTVGANLTGACLRDTRLSQADLSGADLSGADITGARLPDNFDSARQGVRSPGLAPALSSRRDSR